MPFSSNHPQVGEHQLHPPAAQTSASLPAPADGQGGCSPSWLEALTARPFVGGLVVAVLLLSVSLGLSALLLVLQELAR